MRVTKIYCDRCGKEVTGKTYKFGAYVFHAAGNSEGEEKSLQSPEEKEYCIDCVNDVLRYLSKPPEKPKDDVKKPRNMIASDFDKIRSMYRAGKSMEDISKELGLSLVAVSRFIDKEGLGRERYAGQKIPSDGSAAIMQTTGLNPSHKKASV